MTYRKFLYRAAAMYFLAITPFAILAQYSQWHVSPEGERAQMDRIHREAMADQTHRLMSHLYEDDGAMPVVLYNQKKRKWESL